MTKVNQTTSSLRAVCLCGCISWSDGSEWGVEKGGWGGEIVLFLFISFHPWRFQRITRPCGVTADWWIDDWWGFFFCFFLFFSLFSFLSFFLVLPCLLFPFYFPPSTRWSCFYRTVFGYLVELVICGTAQYRLVLDRVFQRIFPFTDPVQMPIGSIPTERSSPST